MTTEPNTSMTSDPTRTAVPGGTIDCLYGLRRDYPLMWEKAGEFDFAERLGGCSDPLMAEIDAALRELHGARRAALGVRDHE